jgi:hypothetical protein
MSVRKYLRFDAARLTVASKMTERWISSPGRQSGEVEQLPVSQYASERQVKTTDGPNHDKTSVVMFRNIRIKEVKLWL